SLRLSATGPGGLQRRSRGRRSMRLRPLDPGDERLREPHRRPPRRRRRPRHARLRSEARGIAAPVGRKLNRGPAETDTACVSRLRESPLALRLYVGGFLLFVWGTALFHHGNAPLRTFVSAFLLTLIPLFFLLRGSRVAWAALLVVELGAAALHLLRGPRW